MDSTGTRMIVRLDSPAAYRDVTASQFECSTRYQNETLELLRTRGRVTVAITGISDRIFRDDRPFSCSCDRLNTVGLLGSVELSGFGRFRSLFLNGIRHCFSISRRRR